MSSGREYYQHQLNEPLLYGDFGYYGVGGPTDRRDSEVTTPRSDERDIRDPPDPYD